MEFNTQKVQRLDRKDYQLNEFGMVDDILIIRIIIGPEYDHEIIAKLGSNLDNELDARFLCKVENHYSPIH